MPWWSRSPSFHHQQQSSGSISRSSQSPSTPYQRLDMTMMEHGLEEQPDNTRINGTGRRGEATTPSSAFIEHHHLQSPHVPDWSGSQENSLLPHPHPPSHHHPPASPPLRSPALARKDVGRLMKMTFNMSKGGWIFPLGLLLSTIAYEVAANRVMVIIAGFYESITSQNTNLFLKVLWQSLIICIIVAVAKAAKTISIESCALQFRCRLILNHLHPLYYEGSKAHDLILERMSGGRAGQQQAADSTRSTEGQARQQQEKEEEEEEGRPGASPLSSVIIDNPDQRITADVDAFSISLATLIGNTLAVPGLVVYYTWYLWWLFGWTAPLACYVFFLLAVLINACMFRPLIRLIYQQERLEGYFRYQHASYRTHIEAITMYQGQSVEQHQANKAFARVVENRQRVIIRHIPLYLTTYFSDYAGSIVNYAAVGASVLWLTYASNLTPSEISGLVAKGSFSCLYLINAFTTLVDSSEAFTDLSGRASRVNEMLTALSSSAQTAASSIRKPFSRARGPAVPVLSPTPSLPLSAAVDRNLLHLQQEGDGLEEIEASTPSLAAAALNGRGGEGENGERQASLAENVLLKIEGLSLQVPGGSNRWLIRGLDLEVQQGEALLLQGPSGVGKSSMIKAMAGLWPPDLLHGRITFAPHTSIFFVPQEIYCFPGTLLSQVIYPQKEERGEGDGSIDLEAAVSALQEVGLGHLLEEQAGEENLLTSQRSRRDKKKERGLKVEADWQQRLSRGEAQRLAIARVLYNDPELLILDEATSALDGPMEAQVMSAVRQFRRKEGEGGDRRGRRTVISTGHRESLVHYHDRVMEITNEGEGDGKRDNGTDGIVG